MADRKYISPADLVGKEIPADILEQLKILGRVQFTPKPTTVSAVSTAGTDDDQSTIDNAAAASGILDHVSSMEDLASQIEDMIDALTKDMIIPVNNDTLRDAVKSLGGDGSSITKDVFDKAQAIINHAPLLIHGQDSFMTALTGNGQIEGDWLECDQVTQSIANTWNTPPPNNYTAEQTIKDESSKIADAYEKNLAKMIIEILQGFFFNMLWAKYLVDLSIINPIRVIIAYPLDGIICLFKKKMFTVKSKSYMDGGGDPTKAKGPVNKILNKVRCKLLCLPTKLWNAKKYKPIVDISGCEPCLDKPCPKETISENNSPELSNNDAKLGGMGDVVDGGEDGKGGAFSDDQEQCVDYSGLTGEANIKGPEGIGLSPECLKNAQTIIEAVVADALSPPDPTNAGLSVAGTQITNQTINL